MTTAGQLLLGTDGQPITVGRADGMSIAQDGTVRSGTKVVGQIAIVSLTNAVKQGDNVFTGTPAPSRLRRRWSRATWRARASSRPGRWWT